MKPLSTRVKADRRDDVGDYAARVVKSLSRDRILATAVELADSLGVAALSMRRLGQELGVEAMSLYNHVRNKDDLLDGMVEHVMLEINQTLQTSASPEPQTDWQGALRHRILTARTMVVRHRWLPGVLESRTTLSRQVILYHEHVLATLRAGGFSNDLSHHALHALGSRALGFAQELFNPASPADDAASQAMFAALAPQVPYLISMVEEVTHDMDPASSLGWCDDQTEFEFSLDVILDGLEKRRVAQG